VTDPSGLDRLTPAERAELDQLLDATAEMIWEPLPGPQMMAHDSLADITGYGGAAGGGKTDLAIGLTFQHRRVGIFRQTGTELSAIVDRYEELFGSRDGYSGSGKDNNWRFTSPITGHEVKVEFGAFPNTLDERKYRGRPHDLLIFDEAAEMREQAVRFLLGWLRTTDTTQRCRALFCFNPPTTTEGRWIVEFFGPWLDKKHPNPAKPGELRWFATVHGREREFDGPGPHTVSDEKGKSETVRALSRTFIPSRITDNPYLMGTGYMTQLMSMPEPLRSQLLYGDFHAGMSDDPYQCIPTSWIEAAMARWKKPDRMPPMDSVGMDVALSKLGRGVDNTVLARRHGFWFDEPIVYPSHECRDGAQVAGYAIAAVRDRAVIHIDLFGVGAEPYGHLRAVHQQVVGCNTGEPARGVAMDGRLMFSNWRSELVWRMREALSPLAAEKTGIALPPNKILLNEMCSFKWGLVGNAIKVESRDKQIAILGNSPDYAWAYFLSLIDTPKMHIARALLSGKMTDKRIGGNFDPYASM
jgi:hypothetical protein